MRSRAGAQEGCKLLGRGFYGLIAIAGEGVIIIFGTSPPYFFIL